MMLFRRKRSPWSSLAEKQIKCVDKLSEKFDGLTEVFLSGEQGKRARREQDDFMAQWWEDHLLEGEEIVWR